MLLTINYDNYNKNTMLIIMRQQLVVRGGVKIEQGSTEVIHGPSILGAWPLNARLQRRV